MSDKELPKIGLGTWMLKPQAARFSTIEAIKMGYRFVDTAQSYGNEKGVGKGLYEVLNGGIVKRDELIIATKVHPLRVKPKFAYKSTLKSIEKLKLDYIDIIYIHWPAFALGYSHENTLGSLSKLVDDGKVKHIGISNFTAKQTEAAIKACDKPIYANQVEHHPYLQQTELLKSLNEKNVNFISYSPLGRGKALKDPIIIDIAKRNKVSSAQVCLAWVISKGAYPIPKATSLDHIKDNYASLELTLSQEDLEKIDEITRIERYVHPPVVAPKEWKKRFQNKELI